MRVVVSGSSGFLGTALCASLRHDGHDVVRLVRRRPAEPDEAQWDPVRGLVNIADLDHADAVVNLSGANVGAQRWTRYYKRLLHDSRVQTTAVLAAALARLPVQPRVFVSASGIGFYGSDRGIDILDETAAAGGGFLAHLCREWEQAASPATAAGITVCHARFGAVLDRSGSAFAKMLPLFRAGLGGSLGSGAQYWSVISLHDAVRALRFMVEHAACSGPYNVTCLEPITNGEFSRRLAAMLNRPRLLPVPGLVLRVMLGQYAQEITGSLCVLPANLTETGFTFDHPDVTSVIRFALGVGR
jgi:hypothetical protein